MTLDIKAIEERLKAATPTSQWRGGIFYNDGMYPTGPYCRDQRTAEANKDLIIHARLDLEALIARVRELEATNAEPAPRCFHYWNEIDQQCVGAPDHPLGEHRYEIARSVLVQLMSERADTTNAYKLAVERSAKLNEQSWTCPFCRCTTHGARVVCCDRGKAQYEAMRERQREARPSKVEDEEEDDAHYGRQIEAWRKRMERAYPERTALERRFSEDAFYAGYMAARGYR